MITALAVCPPAPWLIPHVADGLAAMASETRRCCLRAVASLTDAAHIVIVSVGPGMRDAPAGRVRQGPAADPAAGPTVLPPGSVLDAAGLTRSDVPTIPPVRLAGRAVGAMATGHDEHDGEPTGNDDAPVVTVGTAVGARLLAAAGITTPTSAVQLAPGPGTASSLPPAPDAPTALLVMADGAACHGADSPGGADPGAGRFDDDLADALASGDPTRLHATCARLAEPAAALRAESLPALTAAAQVVLRAGHADAAVLHRSAPFGVGYFVATWRWGVA